VTGGARKWPTDRKLKIFISYSHKDEDFAQELLSGLQLAGFEPYLDKHDIAAGEDWSGSSPDHSRTMCGTPSIKIRSDV